MKPKGLNVIDIENNMARKQKYYEEYYVNDNHLKKLYNLYLHKTLFDKVLDILLFFAILFTIMGILLEYLININDTILHFIHSLSSIILIIFTLELMREYVLSKSTKHFFKKHWIDLSLLVILSFYFLFVTYFGFAKAGILNSISKFTKETKHFRVLFKLIKR
ncbi:MAG: hypothetical protein KC589_10650 [Nanoarchaeota archaeon]|nr:hypothetical protein [Nanoarchaeota archaeon]